jgi:thiol-disulfide isomerase/thioredoxin
MYRNFSFVLLAVVYFICVVPSQSAYAQVSKTEPESITQGTGVVVNYDPKAKGAKFSTDDEIYVFAIISASDGFIKNVVSKMEKAGDLFKFELPIIENAYAISVEFVTLKDWDDKAGFRKSLTRTDGVPARGASQRFEKNYLETFNKEITLYPDNYQAYRGKWFAAAFFDREKIKEIVAEDMKKLSGKVESAELLYALSYGYLLLGQESKSREALKTLLAKYPSSPFLGNALSDYLYQTFAQQIKGAGAAEIDKLIREFIEKYPHTDVARRQVQGFVKKSDFPLPVIESICQKWMEEEPNNPEVSMNLATAYKTQGQKLDVAASLIEKSISLLLQGYDRLYISVSGGIGERLLPIAYLVATEIALRQQNYAKALAAIKAVQALEKETEPQPYLLEGEIWERVGKRQKSESAYLEAARLGSQDAEKALQAIYKTTNGNLDGFAEYLEKAKLKSSTLAASGKEAKFFKATSLNGKPYELSALRGKVVVINFWFIGCAPCRVEMPGLNQLVTEFKDKDVVFLALALDSAEELKKFLKTTKFQYTVIPDANAISEDYEVNSFPTHIVIGRKGQLVGRLMGGSDKRHEQLRPLITRALNEP